MESFQSTIQWSFSYLRQIQQYSLLFSLPKMIWPTYLKNIFEYSINFLALPFKFWNSLSSFGILYFSITIISFLLLLIGGIFIEFKYSLFFFCLFGFFSTLSYPLDYYFPDSTIGDLILDFYIILYICWKMLLPEFSEIELLLILISMICEIIFLFPFLLYIFIYFFISFILSFNYGNQKKKNSFFRFIFGNPLSLLVIPITKQVICQFETTYNPCPTNFYPHVFNWSKVAIYKSQFECLKCHNTSFLTYYDRLCTSNYYKTMKNTPLQTQTGFLNLSAELIFLNAPLVIIGLAAIHYFYIISDENKVKEYNENSKYFPIAEIIIEVIPPLLIGIYKSNNDINFLIFIPIFYIIILIYLFLKKPYAKGTRLYSEIFSYCLKIIITCFTISTELGTKFSIFLINFFGWISILSPNIVYFLFKYFFNFDDQNSLQVEISIDDIPIFFGGSCIITSFSGSLSLFSYKRKLTAPEIGFLRFK